MSTGEIRGIPRPASLPARPGTPAAPGAGPAPGAGGGGRADGEPRLSTGRLPGLSDDLALPDVDALEVPELPVAAAPLVAVPPATAAPPTPEQAAARAGLAKLEAYGRALAGTPAQRAAATAELLTDPRGFEAAIRSLGPLVGTPLAEQARALTRAVAAAATPAALAAALRADPGLAADPKLAGRLAILAQLPDAGLRGAIAGAATALIKRPGGVSYADVKRDPELGRLLAAGAAHGGPTTRGAVDGLVAGWAKASLARHLKGKEGEKEVKQALKAFEQEMIEVAQATGLGPSVEKAAGAALEGGKKQIEQQIKDGQGWFSRAVGAVGGFFGDIIGGIGKGIKWAADKAGDAVETVVNTAGKIVTLPLDLAAAGLDAVGLDGAAGAVREVDQLAEKGVGLVAKAGNDFVDGAGAALGDTAEGIAFMVEHPIETVKGLVSLATHPERLVDIGKAMWQNVADRGLAGGAGYIAGNLATMLFTGGAGMGTKLGQTLQASRFAVVAKVGVGIEKLASLSAGATKWLSETVSGLKQVAMELPGFAKGAQLVEKATAVASRYTDRLGQLRTAGVNRLREAFGREALAQGSKVATEAAEQTVKVAEQGIGRQIGLELLDKTKGELVKELKGSVKDAFTDAVQAEVADQAGQAVILQILANIAAADQKA